MAQTSIKQTGAGLSRVARVARGLPPERRLAAIAAAGLFFTLFLPWYQETVVARTLKTGSESLTGWGAFSWVEAAVLLVSAGVLTLLFQRAEGRAFHVPGGDGGVIMAAGAWTCVLVIWRIFDKQGVSSHGVYAASSGIEWGIVIALAMAALLTYAGTRIRAAHQPEPPLPGEGDPIDQEAYEPISPRDRTGRRNARGVPREPTVSRETGVPRERGAGRGRSVPPEPRIVRGRPAQTDQPAHMPSSENPLRRLFDDRPAPYERPQWSGSEIGAFEPVTGREHSELPTHHEGDEATTHGNGRDAPTRDDSQDAPTRQAGQDAPTRQAGPADPTRQAGSEATTRREHPNRFPRPVAADRQPPQDPGRS